MFQEILIKLQSTASSKDKEALLVEGLRSPDSEVLQHLFNIACNYEINTYLTDIKVLGQDFSLSVGVSIDYKLSTQIFSSIYANLVEGKRFSRKEWVDTLTSLAQVSTDNQFDWYTRSLTKDLVCGVSTGIFNRAVVEINKDFLLPISDIKTIPEWSCMKVSSVKDCQINPQGSYVSVKMDGVNAICIYSNSNWSFYTRSGQTLYLPHIEDFLKVIQQEVYQDLGDFVICGELVSSTRQKTSGLVNSSIKLGSSSKYPIEDLNLYVFDMLPKEAYQKQLAYKIASKDTYAERLEDHMENLRAKLLDYYNAPIKVLDQYVVNSMEEVYALYNSWTAADENCEGIIWNDRDGLFEFKRSKKRARIKAELEADFIITGWEPLKDKCSLVGSLRIETSCGNLTASVGTGLKESDRELLFKRAQEGSLLSSIVQVKYNKVIPHSTEESKKTLFLPVFLTLRESYDKVVADSLTEIKHF